MRTPAERGRLGNGRGALVRRWVVGGLGVGSGLFKQSLHRARQPARQVDHAALILDHLGAQRIDEGDEHRDLEPREHLWRGSTDTHRRIELSIVAETAQGPGLDPGHQRALANRGKRVRQRLALRHVIREHLCLQATQLPDRDKESRLECIQHLLPVDAVIELGVVEPLDAARGVDLDPFRHLEVPDGDQPTEAVTDDRPQLTELVLKIDHLSLGLFELTDRQRSALPDVFFRGSADVFVPAKPGRVEDVTVTHDKLPTFLEHSRHPLRRDRPRVVAGLDQTGDVFERPTVVVTLGPQLPGQAIEQEGHDERDQTDHRHAGDVVLRTGEERNPVKRVHGQQKEKRQPNHDVEKMPEQRLLAFHHSSDRRLARRYRKMRFLATGEETGDIADSNPIHIHAVILPCGSEKHIKKIILSQSPLLPQLPLDQRSK